MGGELAHRTLKILFPELNFGLIAGRPRVDAGRNRQADQTIDGVVAVVPHGVEKFSVGSHIRTVEVGEATIVVKVDRQHGINSNAVKTASDVLDVPLPDFFPVFELAVAWNVLAPVPKIVA